MYVGSYLPRIGNGQGNNSNRGFWEEVADRIYGGLVITVAQGLCKPLVGVRFSYPPPNHVSVAEWSKATICKIVKPPVQIWPGTPHISPDDGIGIHIGLKIQVMRVRIPLWVPITRIGEMVSFVLWEHEAQVRFLHPRPKDVIIARVVQLVDTLDLGSRC